MIRLIDGSLSDKEVLQQLRMLHVGRLDSDSLTDTTVGIFYDVKASGESQRRPQIRPPGFRKTHIDKLVALGLRSRTPDPAKEAEETAIRKNKVVVLMDAFRGGNSSSVRLAAKIGDKVCLRPPRQTKHMMFSTSWYAEGRLPFALARQQAHRPGLRCSCKDRL